MNFLENTLTTPSLLFPPVPLLLVAYTNRFNAISSRIRSMSATYKTTPNDKLMQQIESLRQRVYIIRNMQAFAVGSLFLCVVCMFSLFAGELLLGKVLFGISLVFMLISLGYSLKEISKSVYALNLELSELTGTHRDD